MNPTIVGQQLIRAVRGHRSQIQLARRLGYKGNPVADWEHGRRMPVASELLRACRLVGIDVPGAFARFHPAAAPALGIADDRGVADWLAGLRGQTPLGEVAARSGLSRFSVSRILAGTTRPRVPEWVALVEALTGRVSDLLAELVAIEALPELVAEHVARVASKRLAFEAPWTEALVRLIETRAYTELQSHRPGWLAERVGISVEQEEDCLRRLLQAGVLRFDGRRYAPEAPLTVDTRAEPERLRELKGHWAEVARERIRAPSDGDLFSYNVVSVSRADLARIRELHRAYFREVRAIVAASEPAEVAALVQVQLMSFDFDPE